LHRDQVVQSLRFTYKCKNVYSIVHWRSSRAKVKHSFGAALNIMHHAASTDAIRDDISRAANKYTKHHETATTRKMSVSIEHQHIIN